MSLLQKRFGFLLFWHIFVSVLILVICGLVFYFELRILLFGYIFSCLYLVYAAWCIYSWYKATGSDFDPYLLFLFAMLFFDGSQFFLQLFFPNQLIVLQGTSPLNGNFSDPVLRRIFLAVLLTLCCLHTGAILGAKFVYAGNEIQPSYRRDLDTRVIGYLFLGISIVPFALIQIRLVLLFLKGGYIAIQGASSDAGYGSAMRIIMTLLIPGGLLLVSGGKGKSLPLWLGALAILAYSSTEFLIGDRSSAIMPFLMLLWVWDRRVKRFSRKKLIISCLLLLFVVVPFVGTIRNLATQRVLYLDVPFFVGKYFLQENLLPLAAVLSSIFTAGSSIGHIGYTMQLVPSLHPFGLGESYIRGFSTILPNIFGKVHPGSDLFFTRLWYLLNVAPNARELIAQGWAMGYNMTAEAYYNFGYIGIMVVPFSFGIFLSALVTHFDKRSNAAKIAFLACFSSFIFQIPRGSIGACFRPLFWYALLPYLMVLLFGQSRERGYFSFCVHTRKVVAMGKAK